MVLLYGLGSCGLQKLLSRGLNRADGAQAGFDGPGEVLTASPLHALNQLLDAAIRPDAKPDALLRHREPAYWRQMLAAFANNRCASTNQALIHQGLQPAQHFTIIQLLKR